MSTAVQTKSNPKEEFAALLARFRAEFKPTNEHESFLTEQMAQSRWRLARVHRMEAVLFDQMLMSDADDPDYRALAILQRCATAAERSYYKAHAELMKCRQLRNEPKSQPAFERPLNPPPAAVRNEPKFFTAPGENLALRL